MFPWLPLPTTEINEGYNGASVDVANGIANHVGGDVAAVASQHVGDIGYDYDYGTDMNLGTNFADIYAGNGAFNSIEGSVVASAEQSVGDVDGFAVLF
ncbi:hypothetical protein HDIA_4263 [Hartmannibacter diazotrophicus]|uniref:Uncharacterized protein n=1 Tax=Hartmannibacter diazotrophicus TaxID=1482074 RepID=A0A2C9DBW0_9HYPH|nr:hypothetical protein [Hartmannibacter diazotrophicus]SON57804.1 hypothetical protein HDIA_4263 [Hartmannibacter diazotrophicus]